MNDFDAMPTDELLGRLDDEFSVRRPCRQTVTAICAALISRAVPWTENEDLILRFGVSRGLMNPNPN